MHIRTCSSKRKLEVADTDPRTPITWSLVLDLTERAGANASSSSRKMMDGAQRLAWEARKKMLKKSTELLQSELARICGKNTM